jgi:photosystem II stability/assembly factor-like uncharacterized protein
MKHPYDYSLFLLFLLESAAFSQTRGWMRQNPLPLGPGVSGYGVCALGGDAAYVFGQGGEMGLTVDKGRTWRAMYAGMAANLYAGSFISVQTGWVAGDSGRTWTRQVSGTSRALRGIRFLDSRVGYACGDTATLLKTTDGGATWIPLTFSGTNDLASLFFHNADTGWVAGAGIISRTNDGGVTWSPQGPSNSRYRAIHFANADTGWVGEAFGAVYKTSNGGANWFVLYNFPTSDLFWLYDLHFADTRTGWAAGAFQVSGTNNDGRVMVTHDGGATWMRQVTPVTSVGLNAAFFADSLTGWTAGQDMTILGTVDGGVAWARQGGTGTTDLQDIFFPDRINGWVVGGTSLQSGLVQKTANGGANWQTVSVPSTAALYGIYFLDADTGWLVGARGTVLRTVNAGQSFDTLASDSSLGTLVDVRFINYQKGWAAGSSGLFFTTNGGAAWERQCAPSGLLAAYFLPPDTIYLVTGRDNTCGTDFSGIQESISPMRTPAGWWPGEAPSSTPPPAATPPGRSWACKRLDCRPINPPPDRVSACKPGPTPLAARPGSASPSSTRPGFA